MIVPAAIVLGALARSASAAVASTFTAPAAAPTDQSSFYVGPSNGTITNTPYVTGKVFDRFIQIWLENTDFADAASSAVFQNLSTTGITLTNYYGVTHPSEPNYMASVAGDFFGLATDDLSYLPTNVSSIMDLLDAQSISWATYQENMPTDGYALYNYTNPDGYTYYVRKHNPCILFDAVAGNTTRADRDRNFNDFAVDLGNNSLSQWVFVTPNLRDDAHDTDITYASDWLSYWLLPLLEDPNFNTNRTLILLTFDENETYTINNQVYTILLGGVIPMDLMNTTDDTFYTHYSLISTVENNWDLGNLGRGDTNKTLANVFAFVANATGYQNEDITNIPLMNATGNIPGFLNPEYYVPVLAPNTASTGGGSGATLVAPGTNMSLNASDAPAPVNLTSLTTTTSGAASVDSKIFGVAAAVVAVAFASFAL